MIKGLAVDFVNSFISDLRALAAASNSSLGYKSDQVQLLPAVGSSSSYKSGVMCSFGWNSISSLVLSSRKGRDAMSLSSADVWGIFSVCCTTVFDPG